MPNAYTPHFRGKESQRDAGLHFTQSWLYFTQSRFGLAAQCVDASAFFVVLVVVLLVLAWNASRKVSRASSVCDVVLLVVLLVLA